MTHKIVVRQGGASDATDKDYTDQVPHISVGESPEGLWTAGMLYGQGRSTQFQFRITDDTNEIRALGTAQIEPHNKVTITEDAPGYDCPLAFGRVARKDVGRGDLELGDAREWEVTADDANMDLRGLDLVDVWERPEETGTERLLALGAAFLNGSPRPSTVITVARWAASGESHLVKPNPDDGEATMPAQTYEVGTKLVDIIADCAETEGQEWGVVIHHGSGESHLCFMYTEEDDWDTYPSALAISDVPGEVDNDTTFAPIWDSGAAMEQDGQEVLSGIVSEYGDDRAHVVLVDPTLVDQFDYWVEKVIDATTTTFAGATARAPWLLKGRSQEHVTHQLTLKLPADKVNLLAAGMSIEIRADASRHEESLGGTATRRIAKLTWEPIAPEVGEVLGSYYAHLELDRPEKIARERRRARPGPKAPSSAGVASCFLPGAEMTAISTPNGGFEDGDLSNWIAAAGPVHDATSAMEGEYFYSGVGLDQGQRYDGWVGATFTSGVTYVLRLFAQTTGSLLNIYFGDGNTSYPGAPNPTPPAWGGSGDYTVMAVPNSTGHLFPQVICLEWTPSANRTSVRCWVTGGNGTLFIDGLQAYTGGAGQTTEPIGGDGDGSPGTETGTTAPIDHVHAHGNITTGGPYHMAEDVTIADAGTYFTGTQVEAALQELGAAVGAAGAPTTADYLVGTANGSLSAEIVVGTTPGGELGGTWASPTVDATHSGSTHHTEDHDHDGSPTQQLTQANTHQSPDTDAATSSLHHTLGTGANQAAAGDHTHGGGATITVEEDGDTPITGVDHIVFDGATVTDDTGGQVTVSGFGGGGSLTVEEVDGSPTDSAVTKLVFPNGTLGIASHVATYTPAGGGGGGLTVQDLPLKPGTPTYDFEGSALDGAFSARTITLADVQTQGMDWLGSGVDISYNANAGGIHVPHSNTDLDFSIGGIRKYGLPGNVMIGIAALNSVGTGVGVVGYGDGNQYFASIVTYGYNTFSAQLTNYGHHPYNNNMPYWVRITRVSGTWTGYLSFDGRTWQHTFATRADSVTVDKLMFGTFLTNAYGRLTADYFHVAV